MSDPVITMDTSESRLLTRLRLCPDSYIMMLPLEVVVLQVLICCVTFLLTEYPHSATSMFEWLEGISDTLESSGIENLEKMNPVCLVATRSSDEVYRETWA